MVYFFLYFTKQAISTTFSFLSHFALGNPVDWEKKEKKTKAKRNVETFTLSAVYNLTLYWMETSLNILWCNLLLKKPRV